MQIGKGAKNKDLVQIKSMSGYLLQGGPDRGLEGLELGHRERLRLSICVWEYVWWEGIPLLNCPWEEGIGIIELDRGSVKLHICQPVEVSQGVRVWH